MSYELDDETSELNEVKAKTKELEDQLFELVIIGSENDGPPVTPSIGKVRENDNTIGGTQGKTELGNVEGTINIDFAEFDQRRIFGNAIDDLSLTFTKPVPIPLSLALRLYIKVNDPVITIDGTIVSGVGSDPLLSTEIDDFLDITLESSDGNTINILTVKKNDETAADVVPTFPRNLETVDHTNTSVGLKWIAPGIGSLPITYDVEFSTSSVENPDGSPASPIDTISDIDDTEVTVSGLEPATTYFFWVNAKGPAGESGFVGPAETNTDASYTAGDVNFSIISPNFSIVRASWTQPDGKRLRFTLIRDLGSNVFETVVNNDVPSENDTNTYDDENLDPLSQHNYIFEVRNEFGILISTITTGITTQDLPQPVFSLNPQGRALRIVVNMIAGINLCDIERDIVVTFDERVARTSINKTVAIDTEQQVVEITSALSQQTLFFVRTRFRKNEFIGPFSDAQSITTGKDLPPSPLRRFDARPGGSRTVEIDLQFEDDPGRNESVILSFRLASSIGEFTEFQGNIISRDFPPANDTDDREDRIETKIQSNSFPTGVLLTFRAVVSNLTDTSFSKVDNVTISP